MLQGFAITTVLVNNSAMVRQTPTPSHFKDRPILHPLSRESWLWLTDRSGVQATYAGGASGAIGPEARQYPTTGPSSAVDGQNQVRPPLHVLMC